MKLMVVTPFDSSNFGAFLQAYCLKRHLTDLGHEVTHCLTRDADYVKRLYYHEEPETEEERQDPQGFYRELELKKRVYRLFLEDQKTFTVADPASFGADLYILGSDEIWNYRKAVFRQPLFWGEGMHPVISYAASMGSARPEDFARYPQLHDALQRIDRLMVRDERTRAFVEQVTGKPVTAVCDPTLLLPVDSYGKEFRDPYLQEHDCLLIYSYDVKPAMQKLLRSYAAEKNMKIVGCCFVADWCDHTCVCGPLEFSSLIRQCKEVFTTTFHGTIFCILNHAKFVSVAVSPKTSQILEQLRLEERLLPKSFLTEDGASSAAILQKMEQPLDYAPVDQRILALREASSAALMNAIREVTGK